MALIERDTRQVQHETQRGITHGKEVGREGSQKKALVKTKHSTFRGCKSEWSAGILTRTKRGV